jgi:hypothetical protein
MLGPEQQIRQIIPGAVSGPLAQAYVADRAARDFLTDKDATVTGNLLVGFHENSATFPARLQRAFWNHEYAAGIEWLDIRWTVVATALESLVHTDRRSSTRQFVDRVAALADRVQVRFSRGDAVQAYDLRSRLAHGGSLGSVERTTTDLYCRMEEVLRASIRTAIQDSNLRAIFGNDDRIRAELRATENPRR